MLLGRNTSAFVYAHCKRQGSTSLSTPESETVALTTCAKRSIAYHLMFIRLIKRSLRLGFYVDNTCSERVVSTGMSSAMAYLKRTQALSLAWCRENISDKLHRVDTHENLGDAFTKALETSTFERYRDQMGVRP